MNLLLGRSFHQQEWHSQPLSTEKNVSFLCFSLSRWSSLLLSQCQNLNNWFLYLNLFYYIGIQTRERERERAVGFHSCSKVQKSNSVNVCFFSTSTKLIQLSACSLSLQMTLLTVRTLAESGLYTSPRKIMYGAYADLT